MKIKEKKKFSLAAIILVIGVSIIFIFLSLLFVFFFSLSKAEGRNLERINQEISNCEASSGKLINKNELVLCEQTKAGYSVDGASCDCGSSRCWNGTNCVTIPPNN